MKTLIFILAMSLALAAHAENSVSGQILGAEGLPVSGASVYLEGRRGLLVTVSDLQGHYAFPGLAAGSYTLKAFEGLKASAPRELSLAQGSAVTMDASLDRCSRSFPVTLKISPINGAPEAAGLLHFEIAADSPDARNPLEDPSIRAALQALKAGEYELVLTKPGTAYVGTMMVLSYRGGSASVNHVVHTSGMEIAGEDFVTALSDQAVVMEAGIDKL